MSRLQDLLPEDEQLRLDNCVREPIHVPGAVQAHGALLSVDLDTLVITHVSENTTALLDRRPADLLGGTLDAFLEPEVLTRVRLLDAEDTLDLSRAVLVPLTGERFDLICHRVGAQLVLELEPSLPVSADELLSMLTTTMQQLAATTTTSALVAGAAAAIRRISGFDRVMVYQFYEDHHGEVIADDHVDGMDDYLGLHYPASDIPEQARSLFLKKTCREIVDSANPGVPLLARDGDLGPPLDLSRSELRAVSPHHLQFMANMGQGATLTLSLIRNGELTGMITCAHRGSRRVPFQLRRALVVLVNQLALQMAAIADTGRLERQLQRHLIRMALVQQMQRHEEPVDGLVADEETLLSLVPADGVTVLLAGELRSLGSTPSPEAAADLAVLLHQRHGDQSYTSVAIAEDDVVAAQLLPDVAGIVFAPLGSGLDSVIWYRGEVLQTVDWLGDQTADNRATPLSPRNSFTKWKQNVAGRAPAWDPEELLEVAELRRDVSDVLLRRSQAALAHQGLHDDLTGLPNRRQAVAWLSATFNRRAPNVPVAVLFVDIDKFKYFNDSYGHAIGDQVIIAVGARLKALVSADDIVARLGGDEFMVALRDVSLEAATLLADELVDAFREPTTVHQQVVQMSVSVGLALAESGSGIEPLTLLREADTAMYQAKSGGRNQVSVFEPTLRPEAARRLEMERELSYCLLRDELVLRYQPIFRLSDGQPVGAEALLRWDRPQHGLTYPADFVPILEETGLIRAVGAWVLEEALTQLGVWRRAGAVSDDFCLAVNLSARQFSDQSLVHEIRRLLQEHQVPPRALTLEITETAAMSDRSEIMEAVEKISALGVGLSVDDFGTGYSSMSMLRSLPVTQLKIDKLFVAGLLTGNRHDGLGAAVINLAHQFHLTCVAEGVENAEQLAQLRRLGCDFAQGFHLGIPVTAEEFAHGHQPV